MERMTGRGDSVNRRYRSSDIRTFVGRAAWEWRRLASASTRRIGLSGWAVYLLIVVGAFAWVIDLRESSDIAALHATISRRDAIRSPGAIDTPQQARVSDNASLVQTRLADFESHLLPHDELPMLIQDVLQLAEGEGVSIRRAEYRPQVDEAGGFLRYRMSIPIKGPASNISRFIQSSLHKKGCLALESIHFKRERAESSDIEARVEWVAMTRLPPGASIVRSARPSGDRERANEN